MSYVSSSRVPGLGAVHWQLAPLAADANCKHLHAASALSRPLMRLQHSLPDM